MKNDEFTISSGTTYYIRSLIAVNEIRKNLSKGNSALLEDAIDPVEIQRDQKIEKELFKIENYLGECILESILTNLERNPNALTI